MSYLTHNALCLYVRRCVVCTQGPAETIDMNNGVASPVRQAPTQPNNEVNQLL